MVSFDAHIAGTPSSIWTADQRVAGARELDLSGLENLMVVAAHPDDETLGAGGLMALAAARGARVHAVIVTEGGSSHPQSPTLGREALADRRALEVRTALHHLAPHAQLTWLGYPDGQTEQFSRDIAQSVRAVVEEGPTPSHVATVWSGDGHIDHETVGRVVESLVPTTTTLLSYPIWMWQWARPGDAAVPWQRARALRLSPEVREQKRRSIDAFVSQIAPLSDAPGDERVLEPEFLEHFARDREIFLVRDGSR